MQGCSRVQLFRSCMNGKILQLWLNIVITCAPEIYLSKNWDCHNFCMWFKWRKRVLPVYNHLHDVFRNVIKKPPVVFKYYCDTPMLHRELDHFCFPWSSSYQQQQTKCVYSFIYSRMETWRQIVNGARLPAWLNCWSACFFPGRLCAQIQTKIAQWKRTNVYTDGVVIL